MLRDIVCAGRRWRSAIESTPEGSAQRPMRRAESAVIDVDRRIGGAVKARVSVLPLSDSA